jgi:hypothetical protein
MPEHDLPEANGAQFELDHLVQLALGGTKK